MPAVAPAAAASVTVASTPVTVTTSTDAAPSPRVVFALMTSDSPATPHNMAGVDVCATMPNGTLVPALSNRNAVVAEIPLPSAAPQAAAVVAASTAVGTASPRKVRVCLGACTLGCGAAPYQLPLAATLLTPVVLCYCLPSTVDCRPFRACIHSLTVPTSDGLPWDVPTVLGGQGVLALKHPLSPVARHCVSTRASHPPPPSTHAGARCQGGGLTTAA